MALCISVSFMMTKKNLICIEMLTAICDAVNAVSLTIVKITTIEKLTALSRGSFANYVTQMGRVGG